MLVLGRGLSSTDDFQNVIGTFLALDPSLALFMRM